MLDKYTLDLHLPSIQRKYCVSVSSWRDDTSTYQGIPVDTDYTDDQQKPCLIPIAFAAD